MDKSQYRSLDSLTDSDEEVHANIDTKSYRKFVKEERRRRMQELKEKENLSVEETKELETLEYKSRPVVVEVPDGSFRYSNDEALADSGKYSSEESPSLENVVSRDSEALRSDDVSISNEYAEDLDRIVNSKCLIATLVEFLDSKTIKFESLESLLYYNLSECIKGDETDFGVQLCKIILLVKGARDYGRDYLLKVQAKEDAFLDVAKSHYEASKAAIMGLKTEDM